MEGVNDFLFLHMALTGSSSKINSSGISRCFVISNFSHACDLGSATNSVGIITMSPVLLEYGSTHP